MGISYKNGSGYPDPTAYYAVQHMEAEEKRLHIRYPSGCILRSLADSDAFQSGRCAEHNGRPETLAIIN